MIRQILLVSIVFAVAVSNAPAQQPAKAVSIGGYISTHGVTGFLGDSVVYPLSDFYRGKDLLLVDFWATWCSPCVSAMPKLSALKKQFGDRIGVIAATYEPPKRIAQFFEGNPDLRYGDIRFLVGDTLLSTLFPHKILPHVAWIDGEGKLLATTNSDEVTAENIEAVLQGTTPPLLIKRDVVDFDISANLASGDEDFLFRSILTRYRPGINATGRTEPFTGIVELENDDMRSVSREIHMNTPIVFLYMYAAYGGRFLKMNKYMVALEIADSLGVVHPMSYELSNGGAYRGLDHWRVDNAYCYELAVAEPIPAPQFYRYMMEDLNRYFRVYGALEKRWVDCYVIVNQSEQSKLLHSKGGELEIVASTMGRPRVIERIKNMSMEKFVRFLNYENLGLPILNETENREPLDLEIGMPLQGDDLDMGKLREKLSAAGFGIVKTKRLLDVLVIRDKAVK